MNQPEVKMRYEKCWVCKEKMVRMKFHYDTHLSDWVCYDEPICFDCKEKRYKAIEERFDFSSEVTQALEDVKAEIEVDIEFNKDKKGLVNLLGQGKMMAVQIIDRKIAEVKGDKE